MITATKNTPATSGNSAGVTSAQPINEENEMLQTTVPATPENIADSAHTTLGALVDDEIRRASQEVHELHVADHDKDPNDPCPFRVVTIPTTLSWQNHEVLVYNQDDPGHADGPLVAIVDIAGELNITEAKLLLLELARLIAIAESFGDGAPA